MAEPSAALPELDRNVLPRRSTSLVTRSFLAADASWVLVRAVRAAVLCKDTVVVPTAPSQWNTWAARCSDSSTQRLHRAHVS